MDGVDIDDLQGDVAPAECLTNWGDGCGMVLLQKKQAVSQAKGRSTGPGLFGEAEDATIEPAVFTDTPDAHRDGEVGDTIMSRRQATRTIGIGIDHGAWGPEAIARNDQLALPAWRSSPHR